MPWTMAASKILLQPWKYFGVNGIIYDDVLSDVGASYRLACIWSRLRLHCSEWNFSL